ncbi:HNH endonuclease [Streptomyces sp. NPDC006552]|uniref:HNH endonuclease n=1 Tax=Streptomyces sp. NPDC006552 TaxID=3157179 RepID=UPI0033B48400
MSGTNGCARRRLTPCCVRATASPVRHAASTSRRRTARGARDRYIECHHVVPLHEAGEGRTKLSDLALTCANCHR